MAHKDLEKQFHKYIKSRATLDGLRLIKSEASLFSPYSLFQRSFRDVFDGTKKPGVGSVIGKIDILFRFQGTLYAGEIKYFDRRNDFWAAMKIVAYVAYLNWQSETLGQFDECKPAILIPKSHIRLEHKLICNKLKIALFSISKKGDGFSVEHANP